jgi:hypothetical protein
MTEEGGREVVRRRMERNEGEEGEREAVMKRMERKGEKGGCKHCLEISESFTGDNGFHADRKFKMVDSEGQNCFENL